MTESETSDPGRFLELLALATATGSTVRAAAITCGCSERQGYRLAATPEFKHRVSEIRAEMTNAAVGLISTAASEAVTTIRELLDSTNEPPVRLNAAKAILANVAQLSELGELRQRLDALERLA